MKIEHSWRAPVPRVPATKAWALLRVRQAIRHKNGAARPLKKARIYRERTAFKSKYGWRDYERTRLISMFKEQA